MNYLKQLLKFTCLIMLVMSTMHLSAQSYKGVLNQDLPADYVQEKKQDAQIAAKEIYNALVTKDLNSLMSFVPEKSVYLEMAEQYNYRDEAEKQMALSRIDTGYEEHRTTMKNGFLQTARQIQTEGNLKLDGFAMGFSPKRPFPGGKAGLNFTNQKGAPYQLFLDGLYFFNDRWYVLKAVTLRN